MQFSTVAMILTASVAHAVWNIASKYKKEDTLVFVWAYSCASALLWVPISLILTVEGQQELDWRLAVGAVISSALHIAYSLILQAGYERAELGVVYPIARGSGPVLTILFATLLMGERLSASALLGALLVIAGIFVVTGNPFWSGSRPLKGMIWGAATGTAIAGYTLWDGYSIISLHLDPVNYYASTLLLQSLILTSGAMRRRYRIPTAVRVDIVPILIIAVCSPLAYILVLTAMQSMPLALVAPLRESSIIVGSLLSYWLFHENHLARRIAGAVVVLAGIAVISL
ncbi:EamA family transporter [Salmonella enterica]|uniref:DMT family transporter n=1 Tax=Enterobacter cloacae complex TaxID=354276 RepID=UPI00210E5D7C|nr:MULTISPECIES: DMT family transporter [Enterobacter cloacae complex]MCQ4447594.1 DMT family transporter [Enterobacter cloacae]MDW2870482.1 DMT family transporter [Enterobacter hormaechei]